GAGCSFAIKRKWLALICRPGRMLPIYGPLDCGAVCAFAPLWLNDLRRKRKAARTHRPRRSPRTCTARSDFSSELKKMFCPNCGSEERQVSQFCRACGTDLRLVRVSLEKPDAITASAV